MSKILKGIKLIESPSEYGVNRDLATGKAVRDTNEIQKYAIVDGTGKFIDGPYDYWLEADAKLKGLSKKYAQVKIVPISGKPSNNLEEDLHKWFKEKWVRFGPDGKIRGDCARGDDSEGKPKCLPQSKAHALGKKGRKYAASKKRREDPNPERSGPAKNVATKKKSNESMTGGLDRDEEEFIPQIYARAIPDTKSFLITKVLDANLGLKVGDKVSYIALTRGKFKDIPKNLSYKQDMAEDQLDELKCWPGYSRVQGVPAGAPGSCKKKTNESSEDAVQIKYWQQDTQESGQWAKTKPMPRATAEKIVSSFPRGEIVDVEQDVTENVDKKALQKELLIINRLIKAMKYSPDIPHLVRKKEEILKQLGKQDVAEGETGVSVKKWAAQVRQEHGADTKFSNDKVHNRIIARKDKEIVGSYDRKANNGTVFSPEQDAEFNGDLDSKGRFTKDTVQKMFGKLSPDAKDIKEENCPHCNGPMFSEVLMMEKKDACYYKVKSRYKVWPSAYASGALVKCRNKGAKNWGNKSESAIMRGLQSESLGTQYPSTYEEENEPFKRKGQRRIGTLTTEEKLSEKWSDKYKRSIDCSNPKGFSQRAHCQGKKKK